MLGYRTGWVSGAQLERLPSGLLVAEGASPWSRCRQDRRQEALLSAQYKTFIDIHFLSFIKLALATRGHCA